VLTKKNKIIWLAHEANISGANIAMLEYADFLKNDYYFHFILPHDGNMIKIINEKGFSSSIIAQYNWAVPLHSPIQKNKFKILLRSIIAIFKTCILIIKEKPIMVFTNTQVPFTASIASHILKKPHVWWLHEYGEESFGFVIGFGNKAKAFFWMQKSKLIVASSKAILEKFKGYMPNANFETIYQPVTIKDFSVSDNKLSPYIMFGQLIESKGHLDVLSALRQSNIDKTKIQLHIIGPCEDDIYLKTLQNFISNNGLSATVKIEVGFYEKEKILPKYNCLILASYYEGFGRVIMEASKMGLKAIVNKNSGGAPELINETNGILYNSETDLIDIFNGVHLFKDCKNESVYNENEEITKLKKYLSEVHV
jgi:glycosyltransferase involved in cell wall biosynthesis